MKTTTGSQLFSHTLLAGVSALMGLCSWGTAVAQSSPLRLSGRVEGSAQQGKVYLQKYIDRYYEPLDSAVIAPDGSFCLTTNVELPEIYGLSTTLADSPLLVFLDEGDIRVTLRTDRGYAGSTVEGSATHDLYTAWHRDRQTDLETFIKEHPHSLVPLYILYREQVSRLSSADITRYLQLLDSTLQDTRYARILRGVLATRKATDVGLLAPDFSAADPEGRRVSLSDFTGKGYLLLDFWASWCGPCRRENPHVVAAYRQYHERGFDILAVSLDKERQAWLQAIEKDGLDYHHVSELKFWDSDVARLYGIRSIPANVLIDRDGRIVAKNLRGNDLTDTLGQLLGR